MGRIDPALISQKHSHWPVPLLIFILSLSVRVIYLNQTSTISTFENPIMDEKYHVQLVQQINSESGYPAEPYYRAPLYPYFLAFLFKLTDDSFFWTRLIQLVLGSFLALLIYNFALKVFDRKIAMWSGFIAALYPTLVYFEATLLIESIMPLLTILLVWQLYRCQQTLTVRDFIVAGVLLGLAGLARPNILMLGPFLFIWIALIIKPKLGWTKSLVRYGSIALASIVVIAPVTIRNYTAGNDSVLIAWQGGFNFFLGNNRTASGWSATVEGIDMTWEGGYNQAIALAEKIEKRELKFSEVSDFWYREARKEMWENPGFAFALQVRKLRLLINGFEIPNNQSSYLARDYTAIMKPLLFDSIVFFPYGILAPMALIGLGFSFMNWRKFLLLYLVLGSYTLTLLMFFVCDRFRQPLIPILITLAVFGVVKILDLYKRNDKKNLILVLFVLGLLLLESNHDLIRLDRNRLKAQDHFILGGAHLEVGNLAAAEGEFKKSVENDSTFAKPYNNIGLIAVRRGDMNAASQNFMKAIQLDPKTLEPYMNFATILIERHQYEPALEILLRAKEVQPLNDFVHLKVGLTLYQLGRKEEALSSVEECLRLNPNSPAGKQVIEQLRAELKK